MLDLKPTQEVATGSAIRKGYVRVGNRNVHLDVYKYLNLCARPTSDKGLTSRMITFNLKKFSGETGKTFSGG